MDHLPELTSKERVEVFHVDSSFLETFREAARPMKRDSIHPFGAGF
jgi:hypothetical protein